MRFQTFNQKIADVSISTLRNTQFQKRFQEGEEESFFIGSLYRWSSLNYSASFVEFKVACLKYCQSYEQLVHHEGRVVQLLFNSIRCGNELSLQALLDLLVQLARDFNESFYPYFHSIFPILVELLDRHVQNAELIEAIFSSLAHLFKFLWKYMLKDIGNVYRLYSDLFDDSRREHIRKFAAESFSFLIRKSKRPAEMFGMMFVDLQENPARALGVGCLLFEAIRGMSYQFHSLMPVLVHAMVTQLKLTLANVVEASTGENHAAVVDFLPGTNPIHPATMALVHMVKNAFEYTTSEYSVVLWNILLEEARSAMQDITQGAGCSTTQGECDNTMQILQLQSIIQLLSTATLQRRSSLTKHVAEPLSEFIKNLLFLLQDRRETDAEVVQLLLLETVSGWLQSRTAPSMEDSAKLIRCVFRCHLRPGLTVHFVQSMVTYPMFCKDLLQPFLSFCENSGIDQKGETSPNNWGSHLPALILQTATSIVLHNFPADKVNCPGPSALPVADEHARQSLFGSRSGRKASLSNLEKLILQKVGSCKQPKCTLGVLCEVWMSLVCFPHFPTLHSKKEAHLSLKKLWKTLLGQLTGVSQVSSEFMYEQLLLATLLQCYLVLKHVLTQKVLHKLIPIKSLVSLVEKCPNSAFLLELLKAHLSVARDLGNFLFNWETSFPGLSAALLNNLTSWNVHVRHDSLCVIHHLFSAKPDEAPGMAEAVQHCFNVEDVPITMQSYRQRIARLKKLDFQHQESSGKFAAEICLRFLVGELYQNFNLIWPPVLDLVKSYALGMAREHFWKVLTPVLNGAVDSVEKSANSVAKFHLDRLSERVSILPEKMVTNLTNTLQPSRPDHFNFRLLLWKAMALFPAQCEPVSRTLAPMLLQLSEEYFQLASMQKTQDIVVKYNQDSGDAKDDVANPNKVKARSKAQKPGLRMKSSKCWRKAEESSVALSKKEIRNYIIKTLCAKLAVFSNFSNPLYVYKETELRQLYMLLLQDTHMDIQRLSLECLLAYKFEYLVPYRENLLNLLDDKHFKSEIILFSLDPSAGSVVKEDHRPELIQILVRILYGRMLHKTGKDTSGRSHSFRRKVMVLTFLASCAQSELSAFLDLVSEPFQGWLDEELAGQMTQMDSALSANAVVPLKKQHSFLDIVNVIFVKIGHQIGGHLPSLLRILILMGHQLNILLRQRESVATIHVNKLKMLRQLVYARVVQFFKLFTEYQFSVQEIGALFSSLVWPGVKQLPTDTRHHPSALLKLLHCWGEDPRYSTLLSFRHAQDHTLTVMPYVCQLLSSRPQTAVVDKVLDVLISLLNFGDDQAENDTRLDILKACGMASLNAVNLASDFDIHDQGSAGVRLVIPNISDILTHIRSVVQNIHKVSKTGKGRTALPSRELSILSTLSKHISDAETCKELISLFVPFLLQAHRLKEEAQIDVLNTISNLCGMADEPMALMETLSPLFHTLTNRHPRNLLCELFAKLLSGEVGEQYALHIRDLNSWDTVHFEEPDYMKRLESFEMVEKQIANWPPEATYWTALLHNCCYFLENLDDLSIRDAASHCIKCLISHMHDQGAEQTTCLFRTVMFKCVLPLLKEGLKAKREGSRHEFILLFGHLVQSFPNLSYCSGFESLLSTDPDTDFFLNLTHIQLHRRARALKALSHCVRKGMLKPSVLNGIVLPLVYPFLTDEAYSKNSALVDASIEVVQSVAANLAWNGYHSLLGHFMRQLHRREAKQKLVVRLIVAIIDVFHFEIQMPSVGEENLVTIDHVQNATTPETVETAVDSTAPDTTPDTVDSHLQGNTAEDTDADKVAGLTSTQLSTRIYSMLKRSVIPQLYKCLLQSQTPTFTKYPEDTEILRIPLAVSMVTLLTRMSETDLETNVKNVLLKIFQFLASHSADIRETARKSLMKVCNILGSKYLSLVVNELRVVLSKGYQVHVMCYTVYEILSELSTQGSLNACDIDAAVSSVMAVFIDELFGAVAEEKEVQAITAKTIEARKNKAFDALELLSKHVTPGSFSGIIEPIAKVLQETRSETVVHKVKRIFKKVNGGLLQNTAMTTEHLMVLIQKMVLETQGTYEPPSGAKADLAEPMSRRPESCYLIAKEPTRSGPAPVLPKQTNHHVITEFGLELFYTVLKRSHLDKNDSRHLAMLDGLVPGIVGMLNSRYTAVVVMALRCVRWLLGFTLPAWSAERLADTSKCILKILDTYGSSKLGKAENSDLILACFKVLSVMLRNADSHHITASEIRVVLTYVEQDLYDSSRQSTTFELLRAILARRLEVPMIREVMDKVAKLAITSDSVQIRQHCRQLFVYYLLEYPLGKRLPGLLEFATCQLEYVHETGRSSAIELCAALFGNLPEAILMKHSALFYVSLATRLVSDEASTCRKLASLAIQKLLQRLPQEGRDQLFQLTCAWFDDTSLIHKNLAAQLCNIMITVEHTRIQFRLEKLLDILSSQLKTENFPLVAASESDQTVLDQLLFALLQCLSKLLSSCDVLGDYRLMELLNSIWDSMQTYITHPHQWIRLLVARLFGQLFETVQPETVFAKPVKRKLGKRKHIEEEEHFLLVDSEVKVKSLALKSVDLMSTERLGAELSDQIVRNLVFIGKVYFHKPPISSTDYPRTVEKRGAADLAWFFRKVCRQAKDEVARTPRLSSKRVVVLKWIAAMCLELGAQEIVAHLAYAFPVLCRELTDESNPCKDLKSLATEVSALLKKLLGIHAFNKMYMSAKRALDKRREERRVNRAAQAVAFPEAAARRKIRRQGMKRLAKRQNRSQKGSRTYPDMKRTRTE